MSRGEATDGADLQATDGPVRPAAVGTHRALDLLAAISDLQRSVQPGTDPTSAFAAMLTAAMDLSGSSLGFIGEIREIDGEHILRPYAFQGMGAGDLGWLDSGLGDRDFMSASRHGLIGRMIRSGQPLMGVYPEKSADLPPGHPAVTSFLGLPLVQGSKRVGLIGLANCPGGYSEALLAEFEPLTRICALLMDLIAVERERFDATEILREALQTIPEGFIIFDEHDRFVLCNDAYRAMFPEYAGVLRPGISFEQVVRTGVGLVPADFEGGVETWMASRLEAHRRLGRPFVYPASGGRMIRVDERKTARGHTVGLRTDVTELVAVRDEARHNADKFRSLYEMAPVGLVQSHLDGSIMEANPAFRAMVPAAQAKGLVDLVRADQRSAFRRLLHDTSTQERYGPVEFELCPRFGEHRTVLFQGRLVRAGRGEPHIWSVLQDVTERKRGEAELFHAAMHDPLTGLPNRSRLAEHLAMRVSTSGGLGRFCVMMLDLDGFKLVNDMLGHPAGDHLLAMTGSRLRGSVRRRDMVARLGGDEFAIVAGNFRRLSDLDQIARRLLDEVARPVEYRSQTMRVTGSIGIAVYPEHGNSAEELLRAADLALYRSKHEGRNRSAYFERALLVETERRFTALAGARQALAEDRIVPVFQPIVELATGRPVGVEALMRVRGPDGAVTTADGMEWLFEDPETSRRLDGRMLDRVLARMRTWIQAGIDLDHVSINLGEPMFWRQESGRRLLAALRDHDIAPDRVRIEITENHLFGSNLDETTRTLERLAGDGLRFSLDDFGTGHASLTHLKMLPVTEIKIDRSFVCDIEARPESRTIVESIVGLCHGLGKVVVAEGIETPAQLQILADLGCDFAQGYHIARPAVAESIPGLLLGLTHRRMTGGARRNRLLRTSPAQPHLVAGAPRP
ncbi:bifunctional diguanylate cyclase/phosphodiesterase [Prosthecomicrobium sp. N25]|uniref:bifunctional diguanylate cyclase/phosphodiesterase n=1 Tax=Prosthecomicrobium sp. N25 TaxID=3129254 RepID=UPI00307884D7